MLSSAQIDRIAFSCTADGNASKAMVAAAIREALEQDHASSATTFDDDGEFVKNLNSDQTWKLARKFSTAPFGEPRTIAEKAFLSHVAAVAKGASNAS